MLSTVRELLEKKGSEIWSIDPDASVYEALEMMAQKEIGALLVVERGKLAGIFSERDYARNTIQDERSAAVIPVSDLMTRDVLCVSPARTLEECLALMTEKCIRHLPVIEHDRLVGIITMGDVAKKIISDQKFEISQLGTYASPKTPVAKEGAGGGCLLDGIWQWAKKLGRRDKVR